MIDQFEAEKCLHASSTDNLRLMIIDNRSDPRAIQMVQIPGPELKVGARPRGLPWGGMLALEIDRCIKGTMRMTKLPKFYV